MNDMLDAQDGLYDAAFVSAAEYYEVMQTLDFD